MDEPLIENLDPIGPPAEPQTSPQISSIELDFQFAPGTDGVKADVVTLEDAFNTLLNELLIREGLVGLNIDPLRHDERGGTDPITFSDHSGDGPIYVVDARCDKPEVKIAIAQRAQAEIQAIERKNTDASTPKLIIKVNSGNDDPIPVLERLAAEWRKGREKLLAEQRYGKGWRAAFKRTSAWLNPANGVFLTASAISIALIMGHFAPALLTLAAPYLMTIGSAILTLSAGSLLLFAPWEAYKHYKNWKRVPENNNSHYGDYIKDFFGLKAWIAKRPVSGFVVVGVVSLGIVLSGLMIAAVVGFFAQNSFCIDLLSPLFNAVSPFLSSAFEGVNSWLGSQLLSSAMIASLSQIISAVFVSALPLIIADAFRRLAVTRYDACEASAMNPDEDMAIGFDPMHPDNDPDARAAVQFNADLKTLWKEASTAYNDFTATRLVLEKRAIPIKY